MSKFSSCIILLLISILYFGCDNNNSYPTPRPTAFFRIPTYDSTYILLPDKHIHFEVNASTIISKDSTNKQWYNIHYPQYNATLHCSFSPAMPSTIDDIINNRVERISLNIGNNYHITTELTNDYKFSSSIIKTPNGSINPIQFISTDNKYWVISGSMLLKNASAKNDSLQPVINAVERDIIHALKNIKTSEDEKNHDR